MSCHAYELYALCLQNKRSRIPSILLCKQAGSFTSKKKVFRKRFHSTVNERESSIVHYKRFENYRTDLLISLYLHISRL